MPARTMSRRRLKESRLTVPTLTPPLVDEAGSTGVTFTTLLNPDGDGKNYRLAVWNTSGNLAVLSPGVVQALIVDGGHSGAGTNNNSSWGGPGGKCRYLGALELDAGIIPIAVGAGGVGTTGASVPGGASSIGATATASHLVSSFAGGSAGPASSSTKGGDGWTCGITGAAVKYAPGGGGGNGSGSNGGATGGGKGENTVNAGDQTAGTANTGGGGGGRWNTGAVAGANGGSGLVVVRWEI